MTGNFLKRKTNETEKSRKKIATENQIRNQLFTMTLNEITVKKVPQIECSKRLAAFFYLVSQSTLVPYQPPRWTIQEDSMDLDLFGMFH
jgi:hypothetical protein